MNLKMWQQIVEIKGNILNLVNLLVVDQFNEREEIASELLDNIKKVNCLEEVFRKDTIKSHQLLSKIAENPSFEINPEVREKINFTQWKLIVTLKSMLLSATNALLEDKLVSREEIASRLMADVYCLDQIEKGCIEQLEKTEFPRIDKLCEEIEDKREINNQLVGVSL
jgi:hypothetical protein